MKRAVIGIIAIALMGIILPNGTMEVKAQERVEETVIDGSELTQEEEAYGKSIKLTKGYYLQYGDSQISKVGVGRVNAFGSTMAQRTVSSVSVNVILERLSGGSWVRVTSWSSTTYNDYYAGCSNNVSVGTGSYYRVRSLHFAESDSSSSVTAGIYI